MALGGHCGVRGCSRAPIARVAVWLLPDGLVARRVDTEPHAGLSGYVRMCAAHEHDVATGSLLVISHDGILIDTR